MSSSPNQMTFDRVLMIRPGSERGTEWFLPDYSLNVKKIQAHEHDIVVINFSSEHWGTQDYLLKCHDQLHSAGINFVILCHHPGDHQLRKHMFYYPWWYVYSRANLQINARLSDQPSRLLGCLHGNPRPHRIAHFLALQKRFSAEQMHLSMFRALADPQRPDDVVLTSDELAKWSNLVGTLPWGLGGPGPGALCDRECRLPALTDAFIHIVSETTVIDRIFFSEKIWKPIASGQLFLVFGNPGSVACLRDFGVDVFDDIIDHSRYDAVTDWRDRMNRVHDVIADLAKQDLLQIWHDTLQRRLNNQKRFFDGHFKHAYHAADVDLLTKEYVLYVSRS